jgi:hypothetical protein
LGPLEWLLDGLSHCHLRTGHPWRPKPLLWFTFFANLLSFFFTIRPKLAGSVAMAWLCYWVVGAWMIEAAGLLHALELPYFVLGFFVPVVINAAIYVRHEIDLDASEPVTIDQNLAKGWPVA